MDTLKITLNDYISYRKGVTPDEGEPIFNIISEAFAQGKKVIIDFTDVDMLTTAFLNVVIGNLYKTYNSEQLKELLYFEGLTDSIAKQIKRVTDTAKLFYKDENKFNDAVNQVLNEKN